MDATRTPAPRHWGYPWAMGASLGLAAGGLYYLACYFWGWPWGWQPAAALWLTFFGGVPGLGGLADWLALAGGRFVNFWLRSDDDQPEDVADDPAPRTSPLVGGYLLSEPEQYIHDGLLRLFQHAAAADSLTSTALIPAAFTDPQHWGYWTNLAAKSGFCVKQNGVTTTLPAGRTYAWVVGEIRRGNIIWPDANAPAPLPLPHPFQAGLSYKVEAGKAGKGGQKAGKVAGGYDDDE